MTSSTSTMTRADIRKEARKLRYRFDWQKARRAIRFFERYIVHVKGEFAGEQFKLEPWQRRIIKRTFGWVTEEGLRVIRELYIEVPRKNGKSFLGAGFALYLLYADFEAGAEVVSAAADTEQAALVYDVAKQIVQNNHKLLSITKAYRRAMSVHRTASKYQVLSADAFTKHGKNLSGIIIDELHAQPNRELVDVLTTSTSARRQPLTIYLTTAGYDRTSICWEKHEYGTKVLSGVIKDYRFYPVIFAADRDDDPFSEATWFKANPNLGVSKRLEYMKTEAEKARNNPAYLNTFKRLELNIWTDQDILWMPLHIWDKCAVRTYRLEDFAGYEGYAGLDLASKEDMTSVALVVPSLIDGVVHYFTFMRYFIPKAKLVDSDTYKGFYAEGLLNVTEGEVTDYAFVEKEIEALHERVFIREVAFDRWNASQTSISLDQKGFTMVPFGQGFASMSNPTKELMGYVLEGRLHHMGHKVLRWNMTNATVEQNAAGDIKLSKRKSSGKIDGAVSLVMALDRAMRHAMSDTTYAERGLVSLG